MDQLMDDFGVPTHPEAEKFECPKWDEPGRCICGAELAKRSEWKDAIHQWASIECSACGRGYVDEDDFIAIYDEGLSEWQESATPDEPATSRVGPHSP